MYGLTLIPPTTLRLECRRTGRGAYTDFALPSSMVSSSRTGNHWVAERDVCGDKAVGIVDISNSGHHNCCWVRVLDGKIYEESGISSDHRCTVCPQLR